MDTKICIKCGIEKDVDAFYDAKGKNIKTLKKVNTCKECFNRITHDYTKAHYEERKQRHAMYLSDHPDEKKECRICKQQLPLIRFVFHATKGDLMSSECRECRLKHTKVRVSKKKKYSENIEIPETKICKVCGAEKVIDDFNTHYGKKDLHRNECIICQKKYAKAYYPTIAVESRKKGKIYHQNHKEESHGWHLKRKFKISLDDYQKMLDVQGGKCKICGTDKPGGKYNHFSVDHDHKTGEVRSLLCTYCNHGLGRFMDSHSLLRQAAAYLESFNG